MALMALISASTQFHAGASAGDKKAQILIVYYSHSGHTKLLAEAIATGARSYDHTAVRVQRTNETSGGDLLGADAVIIGSPTYFGSQASEFSAWIEKEVRVQRPPPPPRRHRHAAAATAAQRRSGGGRWPFPFLLLHLCMMTSRRPCLWLPRGTEQGRCVCV
jgi:multimeric flavodoxin WrbA